MADLWESLDFWAGLTGAMLHIDNIDLYTPEGRTQATNIVLEGLAAHNAMPIGIPPMFSEGLRDSLVNELDMFLRGMVTADTTAQQMHNRVSLWLIE